MQHPFLDCLAITLREETGYRQPAGGPYRRHANGTNHIPTRPDGMWFDDDPDDTGGRTAAGVRQDEYDPWRRQQMLTVRDVWQITDLELEAIYRSQYWQAVQGDLLTPGVNLVVFDFAVLCGVATAVRHLQRALGVAVDGHIGQVTLDAIAAMPAAELVERMRAERQRYLRACKTFWKHGPGWLGRVDRITADALKLIGRPTSPYRAAPVRLILAAAEAARPLREDISPTPRATLPSDPETMAQSSTAQAAGLAGSGGVVGMVTQVGQAAQAVVQRGETLTAGRLVIELVTSPAFVAAAIAVVTAAYVWAERRRHMHQQQTIG